MQSQIKWLWLVCLLMNMPTAQAGATGISIQWEPATLTLVQQGALYGRMLRLQDKGILCSYEMAGKCWVRKSADNGKTWQEARLVKQLQGANAANPELLQLHNGRILLFYNQRPTDGIHPFAIGSCGSDDGGVTWQGPPKLIYETGREAKSGCWEPAAMQLASGEIQLFFANNFPYKGSDDQDITLMRSFDNGVTWGQPETVSYRPGHRDGMPVPLVLRNKDMVLAIEDNGLAPGNQLQPAIIHTTAATNWQQPVVGGGSANRWGAIRPPLAGNVYAGAPYIRQLPGGATILSCHIKEGTRTQPQMTVYIGDSEATHFGHPSVPFTLPDNVGGWWNSLFIKDPNTITALSSTTVNGVGGLWAIDGYVMR